MRSKSLKWLFCIPILVFSLTIANVASASTNLSVSPLEKLVWWDAPSFSVDVNVTDVSDLYGWQVNMSWNPAIVNVTTITESNFLKGPFLWDSHPYHDASEPYSEQERTPGSSVTISAGWTPDGVPPPTLVQAVANPADKKKAKCNTDDAEEEWGSFGFDTGSMDSVAELYVKVLCNTDEENTTFQDKIEIEVTNDGGTTWGETHTLDVFESEINRTADVTDDFSWIPIMLNNTNFKVRMRYKQTGATANMTYVDCFAVTAVDTLGVDSASSAYDQISDSYASFRYSEIDGSFTVYDLGHNFPSGVTTPTAETSEIVQVDFNMKYSANASTGSDQYKIAYYVDPSPTETVLLNWTSSATPLGTYTWYNQTEPNGLGWTWTDVSKIKIVVGTDKDGGDSNAVFREYEAWATVTYIRPTTLDKSVAHWAEGYCLFSVLTDGPYPGVSGSGSLASVEFEILDYAHEHYGETNLTITDAVRTWLKDSDMEHITFTPEDGYFRRTLSGDIQGNTPGTPPDGDVDRYDFGAFAGAYGSTPGSPNWNPLADLQGNTPGTPPDGDVDRYDFGAFAGNYGSTV